MSNTTISLTLTKDSSTIYVPIQSFGYALPSGSGSAVFYYSNSGRVSSLVDETPQEISDKSNDLMVLTRASDSNSIVITNDKIIKISASPSSGSIVFYSFGDAMLEVDDTQASIVEKSENAKRNVVEETTTSRTLALTDVGSFVYCSNASATTVTIPTNASVAFTVNTEIDLFGVAALAITADTGVTLNGVSAGSTTATSAYAGCTLKKLATNEWIIVGKINDVA